MLNPEKIHQQAAAERQRALSQQKKRKHKSSGKRFFPLAPESRTVFHRIYPHSPNFFLFTLLPLLLFVTGLVLWYIDKRNFRVLMPWLFILPAISVCTWLIYFIRERIDYRHYKIWRNDLGFPVHGWDHLGESPKFPQWKFWDRNTIMTVQVKTNADNATRKLLTDLLYLCGVNANKTFYEADQVQPGAAGDLRYKWQITGEYEISGSANSSVMGELYLCIDRQLRALHQTTNVIESVTIHFSKDMLEVQPVQVSD
jgi:hypothetical protein